MTYLDLLQIIAWCGPCNSRQLIAHAERMLSAPADNITDLLQRATDNSHVRCRLRASGWVYNITGLGSAVLEGLASRPATGGMAGAAA